MRIVIAGLLGAVVMFLWQSAAHMVLPIGEMGMRAPKNEDVVLQAVTSGIPEPGIYMLPYLSPEQYKDEAAANAWAEKAKANPFAYVVVARQKADPMTMGTELGIQFVLVLFGALIIACLLAATAWSFGKRVVGSALVGAFGWLANTVPQWNWYRFPVDYMVGGLIEQAVGWLLAGVAIAWWLGRR